MNAPLEHAHEERDRPAISVVIPTFNRLQRLSRVLAALGRQTVSAADLEVIVVSDGSTDGTDQYLSSGRAPIPVRFATQENQGPAAARNRAIELATGDLILFLDDDVVPLPDLVAEHVSSHERHGPDVVVIGPMLTPPDFYMTPWVRYEQAMLEKQYDAMTQGLWRPTARQFYTGNASVERRHVVEAGGFDTAFTRAEDVEFAYRLRSRSVRFVFVPQAAGHHYAERHYESWRNNAYQYGRNDIVFARDKGQRWLLSAIPREFGEHHPLIRGLTRQCLSRPLLRRFSIACCERVATVGALMGADAVSQAGLSAVYNVTYYQGAVDEIGSSEWLLQAAADESAELKT